MYGKLIGSVLISSATLGTSLGIPFVQEFERVSSSYLEIRENFTPQSSNLTLINNIISTSIEYLSGDTYMANKENDKEFEVYLELLKKDNYDEEEIFSCDFISNLYINEREKCLSLLTNAFRFEDYFYAKNVIKSIIFSEIDYLTSWFKELLVEGIDQKNILYFSDLLDMYKDVI